ncbi:NADPH-dependent FMN reductase [Pseudoxanthomonas sp.]|uniref:NADPH-dependent FMN reductase n=1 Tax=Pseudoxanthomonas sp. TaxID=1871049 RepID=UPI002638902D|nr:NADPH-dependent FMN reductase [Pseudoxanthomonas sp.]WDS34928.1 MAG: NAD(P)H-dependent oxidoreductase [Pseudoxanthomonas sp.]
MSSTSSPTVAVLIGSLRRDSINRKLVHALAALAGDRLQLLPVALDELPMYNDDLWADPPAAVLAMKARVEAADAVLFVTPEYNRSFSPVIKNAIDWGTRPYGQNCWEAKPAAIIGTSPGAIGTAAAQNALKGLVTVCDMVLMGQPELYFTWKPDLFDAQGQVSDERTRVFLDKWVARFSQWIARTAEARTDAQADAG